MKIKSANTLTIKELPEYFAAAVDTLSRQAPGFVTRKQIRDFKAAQSDINMGAEVIGTMIDEINKVLKLSIIINS